MKNQEFLTADEAAEALGVSLPTLYAYVSRGVIRSVGTDGDKRKRLYVAKDVRRFIERRTNRRDPDAAAERALDWGPPVVESQITLISGGEIYYRGYRATELAQTRTVEEVAALIWTGAFDTEFLAQAQTQNNEVAIGLPFAASALSPVERFQLLLPLMAHEDPSTFDLRPATLVRTGTRILYALVAACGEGDITSSDSIAERLAAMWKCDHPQAVALLSAALILCADHELNVSTFTARCVASSGTSLYGVILAALCALQGVKHGGETLRVAAFLREVEYAGVRQTVADRLARGEAVSGFGHKLYPLGDPRGRLLLDLTTANDPHNRLHTLKTVVAHVEGTLGIHPTVDMALVSVEQVLGLPPGSALTLFALGRTIGWVGHALEQYATDRLIRPRATYTGVKPGKGI